MNLRFPLPFVIAFAAACSGNVDVESNPTTTTSNDEGGAGGQGGATTVTTSMFQVCGGNDGIPCGFEAFCDSAACGGQGTCQPKPQGCTADCPGVCGCDGKFYCNACEAHGAGVTVSPTAECGIPTPTNVEYKAAALPTNAPRYAIFKAEHASGRCLIIRVAGFAQGVFPNVDVTMGWQVEDIVLVNDVSPCVAENAFPPPEITVSASDAKGSIKQNDAVFPCFVDVDVTAAFPSNAPVWASATDDAQAFGLKVDGVSCTVQ